jgi:hypothetical protein
MEQNPYQAPAATVSDAADTSGLPFYVVSRRKFLWLMIGTLGVYSIYWFYRHWKAQNTQPNRDYWPIPRAIFSIFFTHALFREMRHVLDRRGDAYAFDPGPMATLAVVGSILSNLIGRLAGKDIGSPLTDVVAVALLAPVVWSLLRAQLAANRACGDPEGAQNADLTAANIVWLVVGGIWWLLTLLGLYLVLFNPEALA